MASRPHSPRPIAGAFGLGLGIGFLLGFLLRSGPGSRRVQEAGVLLHRIGAGSRAESAGGTARPVVPDGVELQPVQVPPQRPSPSAAPGG
jgi:hypothetical protein